MTEKPYFIPDGAVSHESFSEENLGGLQSAVGNHEGKALLLTLMAIREKLRKKYSRTDLHSLLIQSQAIDKGWAPGISVPGEWCELSFLPNRLVEQVSLESRRGTTVGHRITPYGDKFGVPFGGHMLGLSERHDKSLHTLFGSSHTPRNKAQSPDCEDRGLEITNRSPLTRYRIFNELLSSPQEFIREQDLKAALINKYPGEYHRGRINLREHLDQLSKNGIINFVSRSYHKPFSSFTYSQDSPADKPQPYKYQPTRTNQIYTLLKSNPERIFTIEDVCSELSRKGIGKTNLPSTELNSTANVLRYLANQGYAVSGRFSAVSQTEISLSEPQRQILTDAVVVLNKFTQGDKHFLEEGRELAREITSDPERSSALMRKAKESSPFANKLPTEETVARIEDVIASPHIGECNVRYIRDELERKFSQRLTLSAVNRVLKHIRRLKVTERGKLRIYAKENDNPPPSGVIFESTP